MPARDELVEVVVQLKKALSGMGAGSFPLIDASLLVRGLSLTLEVVAESEKARPVVEVPKRNQDIDDDDNKVGLKTKDVQVLNDRIDSLEQSIKNIAQNIEGFHDDGNSGPTVEPFEYSKMVQERMDALEKHLLEGKRQHEEMLREANAQAKAAVEHANAAAAAAKKRIESFHEDAANKKNEEEANKLNAAAAAAAFEAAEAEKNDAAKQEMQTQRELRAHKRKIARERWLKAFNMIRRAMRVKNAVSMIHSNKMPKKSVFERLGDVEALSMKNDNNLTRLSAQVISLEVAMKNLAHNLTGTDEKITLVRSSLDKPAEKRQAMLTQDGALAYAAEVQKKLEEQMQNKFNELKKARAQTRKNRKSKQIENNNSVESINESNNTIDDNDVDDDDKVDKNDKVDGDVDNGGDESDDDTIGSAISFVIPDVYRPIDTIPLGPHDVVARTLRAKQRWKKSLVMIVRANRVRRAMTGALQNRAAKGESILEKLTFLERKVLYDEAQSRRKLAELEMSLKNLAMHVQGFSSNLATWKNDYSTGRSTKTPVERAKMAISLSEMTPSQRARYRWKKTIRLVIIADRMQTSRGVMSSNFIGKSVLERIVQLEKESSRMLAVNGIASGRNKNQFEGMSFDAEGEMVPISDDNNNVGTESKDIGSTSSNVSFTKASAMQDRLSGKIPSIFDVQKSAEKRAKMLSDQIERQQQIITAMKANLDKLSGSDKDNTFATADALKQALIKRDVEIKALKDKKADKEEMLDLIVRKADLDQVNPIMSKIGDLRDQFLSFSQEHATALEGVVSSMIESYLAQANLPSSDAVASKKDLETQLSRLTSQMTESIAAKADKTAVSIEMQGKADRRIVDAKADQDTMEKIQQFFQSRMDELSTLANAGASEKDLQRLKEEMEADFKKEMDLHLEERGDHEALATTRCIACGQMPQQVPTVAGHYAASKFQLKVRPLDPRVAHRLGRDGVRGYNPPNQPDYVVAGGYHMPNSTISGLRGKTSWGAAVPQFNNVKNGTGGGGSKKKNGPNHHNDLVPVEVRSERFNENSYGQSQNGGQPQNLASLTHPNNQNNGSGIGGGGRPRSNGARQPTRLMTLNGLAGSAATSKQPSPRPQMEGDVQQWVETAQRANNAAM